MPDLNVSLPDTLKAWADTRVAQGAYISTDDYIRDLMRRDQDAAFAAHELQAAIDIGRASPPDDRTIEDIIAARRG